MEEAREQAGSPVERDRLAWLSGHEHERSIGVTRPDLGEEVQSGPRRELEVRDDAVGLCLRVRLGRAGEVGLGPDDEPLAPVFEERRGRTEPGLVAVDEQDLDAPDVGPGDDLTAVLVDRLDGFTPESSDVTGSLDDTTHRTAGGDRHVETRVSTLTDRAGEELSRALLLYDVTDRERRERELRRKNEFLDEFASVVSRDVATPLGVVENRARLVEMTGDTEHVEDIYEATDRIEELVDGLLALARQGREVGETRPVDLDIATREAWQSVDGGRAQLTVADTARVEASPERLRQLLENLLVNAVEHSSGTDSVTRPGRQSAPAGTDGQSPADGPVDRPGPSVDRPEPPVRIRVGPLADGDGFYVADDGPKVPVAERDEVFEQGYTTEEGGTGLGLAIVRRIAQAHGWEVAVTESDADGDSEGGEGFGARETVSHGARFEVRGVDTPDESP